MSLITFKNYHAWSWNGSQQSLSLLKQNLQHANTLNNKQQQAAARNEDPEDWTFIIIFVNILN